jgi:hypothetical protein
MADSGLLTLRFPDKPSVEAFAELLASLNLLYEADARLNHRLDTDVEKTHILRIQSLHISSPGILEVIGSLNPLKFIHDMTKLILDFISSRAFQRLSYEEKKLEIEKRKIEILDAKAELLRKWGVRDEAIQEGLIKEVLGERVSNYAAAVWLTRVENVEYKELSD